MDSSTIQAVWDKGTKIPGQDGALWRRDAYGKIIKRSEFRNRDSGHGWEIDHVVPVSSGGSDVLSNLRPLYWENHARRRAKIADRGSPLFWSSRRP